VRQKSGFCEGGVAFCSPFLVLLVVRPMQPVCLRVSEGVIDGNGDVETILRMPRLASQRTLANPSASSGQALGHPPWSSLTGWCMETAKVLHPLRWPRFPFHGETNNRL
jgi:hypothetical protein